MIIAHTGDSHISLSAKRTTLDKETGLNAAMMDRYRCARFVIEDAVRRGADLILHAGDMWGGDDAVGRGSRPTPTQVRLAKQALAPATERGKPVVIIKGNHDDVKSPIEFHALDLLREMEGMTIVDRPCLLNVWAHHLPVEEHTDWDEVYRHTVEPLDFSPADGAELVLQIACLPYPNPQLILRDDETRALDPAARNQLLRERMMDVARGLAAQRIAGVPCVMLGHFAVDTAVAGTQNGMAMLTSEFTLNVYELQALGFQAIMLGHYHKPQFLDGEYGSIAYSGSPEATAFGEEGEEKRYLLWDIEYLAGPNEPPAIVSESIPTPYRRLRTLSFPDDLHLFDNSPTQAFDIEGEIIRLKVRATDADQVASYTSLLTEAGAHEVRVEIERVETVRRRESDIASATSLEQALDAWLIQKPELKDQREALLEEAQRVEEGINAGA